jgi:hypothetical protein
MRPIKGMSPLVTGNVLTIDGGLGLGVTNA